MSPQYTTLDEIPGIVARLRDTFKSGKTRNAAWRKDQLKHLAYMIQDNEKEIYEAVRKDLGRSDNETHMAEIGGTLNEIITAVSHVEGWAKPERPKTSIEWGIAKPTIHKTPKGVALIIGTWNYPISLTLGPLVGAIAAGCPAIIKTSEVSQHAGALLGRLIPQYLDSSAYAVVQGEVDVITRLLGEPWGHIFYTGNAKVARIISGAAAKTLTPVTLELGGKSPCIIDPDLKELDVTARRILWGKRLNCGQTCIAPDYIIVQEDKQAALMEALKKEHALAFPTKSLEDDEYPRIVSYGHYDRLKQMLDKTGGNVAIKGEEKKEIKMMGVSVVTDVTWDDELMKSEIFGPILPIVPVTSISSAIEHLKDDSPLAMYIFSQSDKFISGVRDATTSGAVLVNDVVVHFNVDGLPFGGVGESGQGSYHGKRSFDVFTHERSSLANPFWADPLLSIRYYPYTDFNSKIFRALMVKRIGFARPGSTASLFGPGGWGRKLIQIAVVGAVLAVLSGRWSWLVSLVPRYKLVRVA